MEPKPQISGDVKNVHHLVNRAKKALVEAGVSEDRVSDMQERVLNENNRWTLDEAKAIVADYVELV